MTRPAAFHSWRSKSRSPIDVVHQLAALMTVSVILGGIVPGMIARHDHVFLRDTMEAFLKTNVPDAAKKIGERDALQAAARSKIESLDQEVIKGKVETANIAVVRQAQVAALAKTVISVQPFYQHLIMYFWPIMFFGLATAIVVIRPSVDDPPLFQQIRLSTFGLAVGIFLFSAVPLSVRVYALARIPDRKVYAYTNPDISPSGFELQLVHFFIFSFALAVIWRQWSAFADRHKLGLAEMESSGRSINIRLADDLSGLLYRWQLVFVAISTGFVIYTGIFWNQIIVAGDKRFIVEAIVAHVLWIATIAITLVPLMTSWRAWRREQLRAIAALINDPPAEVSSRDNRIAAIKDLSPIPGWNLTASALAVMTSLAGPLVQALLK